MNLIKSFAILFLLFFQINKSFSQVVLTDSTRLALIGTQISILDSNKNELQFSEIVQYGSFRQLNQEIPNLGIQKDNVWLRFMLINKSKTRTHFLLNIAYPILDSLDLFTLHKGLVIKHIKMGEGFKFHDRKYDHPNFVFDIDIPISDTQLYFLRVKSTEQIITPISIGTPENQLIQFGKENALSGVFLGVILIMIFYNIFIFFSVKDKGYLYYVFYVVFVGLTQLGIKGYNYQYLWPNTPVFQERSIVIFACISSIAALLFAAHFLKLKITAPKGLKFVYLFHGLFSISLLSSALGFVQFGFQLMLTTTTFGSIVLIVISFYVMIKGFEPAKYFFAAWSVLLVGSIIFLLKDYGVLPFNIFTSYSFQAATAVEMALLSFGLANSINILKKEKELSQLQALQAAQKNEKLITEQNIVLEQKVAERTHELHQTNENLSETLDNLKQAQSQLVESEKMASLGQLTAGIAHEINNPINFVTSNVNPLKRDVGMLFEAIDFIEQKVFEITPVQEKREQIEEYKEELDFDYLKEEIEHLLNGIQEGSSRTAEIVKGLRIFSRIDEYDLKKANINEGLDSTLIIINNLLNGTIKIVKEYDVELPTIECYPGKLNQVFLNMFNNSIHAIRAKYGDKVNGIITIKTKTIESGIKIVIADNGIGMDEATKHKIYEPFFTTKEVGVGTGLGMSIVYNTIKKHEGKIELNSIPGEGTTFEIYLPFTSKIL